MTEKGSKSVACFRSRFGGRARRFVAGRFTTWRKKPGSAGELRKLHVDAYVVVTGEAIFAVVTIHCGFENCLVTCCPSGYSGSCFDHLASGLMSQHHGVKPPGCRRCRLLRNSAHRIRRFQRNGPAPGLPRTSVDDGRIDHLKAAELGELSS